MNASITHPVQLIFLYPIDKPPPIDSQLSPFSNILMSFPLLSITGIPLLSKTTRSSSKPSTLAKGLVKNAPPALICANQFPPCLIV